jgi:hypothetical protein
MPGRIDVRSEEVIKVCDSGECQPASAGEALAMMEAGLDYLNGADTASMGAAAQGELLKGLERAESKHAAARVNVLAAFAAGRGFEADGQYSARAWLIGQTRITRGAAGGAVGWLKRARGHCAIWEALAAGQISVSWAREICAWTDRLPEDQRDDADQILLAAAAGGAALADLGALAWEMYQRSRAGLPDTDPDDGFADRGLQLGQTFGQTGRLEGDLTAAATAALRTVLDALAGVTGPEDTRTAAQRRHDALEEACLRLIAAGMLPQRAGQPVHLQVQVSLDQLRGLPGASRAEAAWTTSAGGAGGGLTAAEAQALACDATIYPMVTGTVDHAALDTLVQLFLTLASHQPTPGLASGPQPPQPTATAGDRPVGPPRPAGDPGRDTTPGPGTAGSPRTSGPAGPSGRDGPPDLARPDELAALTAAIRDAAAALRPGTALPPGAMIPLGDRSARQLRRALLALAANVLSGPAGLAATLRAGLLRQPFTTISLPLDVGAASEVIPGHLRRAVIARDRHCAFPGCTQPPSVCQVHHLTHREHGGPTALPNLALTCRFHHLTVLHRWGWKLTRNPDGTTTATSPNGHTLHSHSPPSRAA